MTDFLNRLIERLNGRSAIIQPLLRSNYAVNPQTVSAPVTESGSAGIYDLPAGSSLPEAPKEDLPAIASQTINPGYSTVSEIPATSSLSPSKTLKAEPLTEKAAGQTVRIPGQNSLNFKPLPIRRKKNFSEIITQNNATSPDKPESRSESAGKLSRRDLPDLNEAAESGAPNIHISRLVPAETRSRIKNPQGITARAAPAIYQPALPNTMAESDKADYTTSSETLINLPAQEETADIESAGIVEDRSVFKSVNRISSVETRPVRKPESRPDIRPISSKIEPGQAEERAFYSESTSAPQIRVNIGRVEVRAIQPPPPPAPRTPPPRREAAISLETYLKGRSEEKR